MLCSPRYLSAYVLGVGQAMGLRGDWHRLVSLWDGRDSIAKQIAEMAPDVIWTHMACWPPEGSTPVEQVAEVLAYWKRRGAVVFLHDGDPRDRTIPTAVDVPACFTRGLLNRSVDESNPWWGIEAIRWPYAAMAQREMVQPTADLDCDLLFAGLLRREEEKGGLYGERTALVHELQRRLWPRMQIVSPGGGDVNNRMHVADVAARVGAVLGFGRPDVPGWIDTRVFQWPGAGAVLIHDDTGGVLEDGVHFLRFSRKDGVDGVLRAVERAKTDGAAIRARAFAHIQAHHTWCNRVDEALEPFFGRAS